MTELPDGRYLPPFAALRAFDAVARLGGVRKAGQELNLDHAVISRHVRALEEWTGQRLIERTRRGTVLTDAGQQFHLSISEAINLIANATRDLTLRAGLETFRIWCMPALATNWLLARLEQFEAAFPNLAIELRTTNEAADIARGEADVDIRFSQSYGEQLVRQSGTRVWEFSIPETILVASPDYLVGKPPIRNANDVLAHDLVHRATFDTWAAWFTAQGIDPSLDWTETGPRLTHGDLMLDAAMRGRGISLANSLVAQDALDDGRLVEVVATETPFKPVTLGTYVLIAKEARWDEPHIAQLSTWLQSIVNEN